MSQIYAEIQFIYLVLYIEYSASNKQIACPREKQSVRALYSLWALRYR